MSRAVIVTIVSTVAAASLMLAQASRGLPLQNLKTTAEASAFKSTSTYDVSCGS